MHGEETSAGFLRRTFRPEWIDLAPLVTEDEAATLDLSKARTWSLVLSARNIPHRTRTRSKEDGGGHTVQVQPWFVDRAVEEIRLYLAENAPDIWKTVLPDLRPVGDMEPTVLIMTAMVLFYWLYNRAYPALKMYPSLWVEHGSSEAARIMSGEWWRVFTALTLHGDGAHVMGNALIGGVFVWLVARRLGSGLAWLLVILSGGIGNLINALALAAPHNSIGFSTASFAAAGILAAIAPFGVAGGVHGFGTGSLGRRVYRFIGSALVPVGAGLGLLAMLGTGKETDLGAHLFGFLCGLAVGCVAGLLTTRLGLPAKRTDNYLLAGTMTLIWGMWVIAWLA
ncbi:rhomboid family intramembrane serine protease [Pseudodesulfovibrio sp. zrk46]|uniref:rhomboid family intramembrane serine protease n=1 Tax=Pseudodesulfovibrio sp. zrk46 TaxID=2725288 RepID=UPI0014498DDA|nr:rhomboid family intramembrane serine protease [Pseudodesulfovibrio sp. zrk46]QJB55172.1 rhomboid family intramembrane serine protease [Pseudodesulfovibrio sp. zrk46]